ncbi:hypothetical protein FB567DRAFT_219099 [Paraphoma chrysanthemicola]|uniref:Uncharacterized protein n=1 Tax=Paraphoma chrysanthemicola TaxID=798071 RepID=A0A8K0VRU5_9PLEO|nr:hypothetical protein FB567DRAFT_219099 [Paraphoma chrysanthemicola]
MYACAQCDRKYASQNSLTRHIHSHEKNTKHQCKICGVVFYRKDLLSRHSKLHKTSKGQGSRGNSSEISVPDHLGAGLGRRRCHTACIRCRELRTKCDGQRPCLTCRRSGGLCTFSRPTNRLSHVPVDSEDQMNMVNEFDPTTELRAEPNDTSSSLDLSADLATEFEFETALNPFMVDMEAWPWMHESLYLPNAPFLPNTLDVSTMNHQDHGTNQDIAMLQGNLVQPLVNAPGDAIGVSIPVPTSTDSPTHIIKDLIAFATASDCLARPLKDVASFWTAMSSRLQASFDVSMEGSSASTPILYSFVNTYMEQFGPLWPLLSPQTLDFDALHPQLFLVLTSIGAMYCGSSASTYGAMIHTAIRSSLTAAVELEDDETDLTWLAQARLLTQVAALYFGQPRAFTFAQHIGALLVAQARKMDLFSERYMIRAQRQFDSMSGTASDQERLALWLQMEARRRLAFGIFRGDTYTSVMLHTKPLISLEEIDLCFPTCDSVWRGERMPSSLCIQLIDSDHSLGRELRASDVYRIAMDRKEPLPPLDPSGHELLMFGLQYPIWRFSRDESMLNQLVGNEDISEQAESPMEVHGHRKGSAADRETYRIDSATRQMDDLRLELSRLICALRKWEQALPLVKTFTRTDRDRSSLMSGLILYHLGFIRLEAPLASLHQIQYRLADGRIIDDELIASVRLWIDAPRCQRAAKRACNIWTIIAHETQKPSKIPIKFNLLAFIGLHHAAVILWSYAGGRKNPSNIEAEEIPLTLEDVDKGRIDLSDQFAVLGSFSKLYESISSGRWSSFAQAAEALSRQELPAVRVS